MKVTIEVSEHYLTQIKELGWMTPVLLGLADKMHEAVKSGAIKVTEGEPSPADELYHVAPILNHIYTAVRTEIMYPSK